jgi:hypothetical protein
MAHTADPLYGTRRPGAAVLHDVPDHQRSAARRSCAPAVLSVQIKEYVITAPGNTGGANWGSPSFSPRTGFLYATGKNDAHLLRVNPVGDRLAESPGPANLQHPDVTPPRGVKGVTPSMGVGAYEPGTGNLMWYAELPGVTSAGSLVNGGRPSVPGNGDRLLRA